ncbi:DNA-directed RNA polymerase [Phycomyces nitens]|nr:DNA-directed RNA polymerase [Phycomyces nitens]
MEVDTRIPNAATFRIEREDHTLANMLRAQLLKDPRVLFAGYKVPHPLEHNFLIKVQTVPGTAPGEALKDATSELISEINALKNKFDMDVIRHRTFEDAKQSQAGGVGRGYEADQMSGMDQHRAAIDVDF